MVTQAIHCDDTFLDHNLIHASLVSNVCSLYLTFDVLPRSYQNNPDIFLNLWPGVTTAVADGSKSPEKVMGEEYEYDIEYIEEEIEEEIPTDDESLAVMEHDQSAFTAKGEESEAESIPEEKNGGPTNGTYKAWNNFTKNNVHNL